jgi:hypothetical protein
MLNTFIQCIQQKLPCISVQALHIEGIEAISDVLARGIPILFLDSRKRTKESKSSIKKAFDDIKKVRTDIKQFDWYTSGQISLLNEILKSKFKSKVKTEDKLPL